LSKQAYDCTLPNTIDNNKQQQQTSSEISHTRKGFSSGLAVGPAILSQDWHVLLLLLPAFRPSQNSIHRQLLHSLYIEKLLATQSRQGLDNFLPWAIALLINISIAAPAPLLIAAPH
jgi:hypothetical protein